VEVPDMSTITDPERLVRTADIADLVVAYATGCRHPFAISLGLDEVQFICPRCGRVDHNGGTARVLDFRRWSCHWCRHVGTRWHLERLVLEDASMLEALYEAQA
ncbi:MAG: hypothetical protein Q8M22_10380, partial [Actinomycetota bacterium]|nr:hypothetical protein [Actinomycetota bacterium]